MAVASGSALAFWVLCTTLCFSSSSKQSARHSGPRQNRPSCAKSSLLLQLACDCFAHAVHLDAFSSRSGDQAPLQSKIHSMLEHDRKMLMKAKRMESRTWSSSVAVVQYGSCGEDNSSASEIGPVQGELFVWRVLFPFSSTLPLQSHHEVRY